MNGAHLHLILNHVPVLGIPFSLLVLLYGTFRKSDELTRLACWLFVFVTLLTIPAYLTGESAEDVLKHLSNYEYPRSFVHEHEEAGELGLVLTLVTGVISLVRLFGEKIARVKKWAPAALLLFALASTGSLVYTAMLGGLVRHTEIRE